MASPFKYVSLTRVYLKLAVISHQGANSPVSRSKMLHILDNLLHKFQLAVFRNQISKWRSFEKGAIFDLFFNFFSHQEKYTKVPSAHISLTYIPRDTYTYFAHPIYFFAFPMLQNCEFIRYGFSLV